MTFEDHVAAGVATGERWHLFTLSDGERFRVDDRYFGPVYTFRRESGAEDAPCWVEDEAGRKVSPRELGMEHSLWVHTLKGPSLAEREGVTP